MLFAFGQCPSCWCGGRKREGHEKQQQKLWPKKRLPRRKPMRRRNKTILKLPAPGNLAAPALGRNSPEARSNRAYQAHHAFTVPERSAWVPSSETAGVAGRDVGGMVYVGTPPLLNTYGYRDKCRAYIDPSLSVARTEDRARPGTGCRSLARLFVDHHICSQCEEFDIPRIGWRVGVRTHHTGPGLRHVLVFLRVGAHASSSTSANADAQDIIRTQVRRLMLPLYSRTTPSGDSLGEFLDIAMLADNRCLRRHRAGFRKRAAPVRPLTMGR